MNKLHTRTKIVATLGPATDEPGVLAKLFEQGVDVVRLNFSHGTHADHQQRIEQVIQYCEKNNQLIGILADLQGPKIRIASFKHGFVVLKEGQFFVLDADLDEEGGNEQRVGIAYKALLQDVKSGDTLLLDDGRIVFQVTEVKGREIHSQVTVGGKLSDHKGINRLGGGLSAKALTQKDRNDIRFIGRLPVDYVAVSFPRDANDIEEARTLLKGANCQAGIVAKIERAEAIDHIDEIIQASDGVMVARGDLAVEIGDAQVPAVQKSIILRARALNKPVITATQMMESMVDGPVPTRAEVSDVANAVLDHTDAVMLSAETASGHYPVQTVSAMERVCVEAEKHPSTQISNHRVECKFQRPDEAIAMASIYLANHMNVKAIIALTESGATPLLMSRIRTGIPIYGLSRHRLTLGKMTLYRGVYPVDFNVTEYERVEVNMAAVEKLQALGYVVEGDQVLITKGGVLGTEGWTNSLRIVTVGEAI